MTESVMQEYYRWWNSITREGDPSRRPNLSIDSFKAGWHAHSMAPDGGWPEERGPVERPVPQASNQQVSANPLRAVEAVSIRTDERPDGKTIYQVVARVDESFAAAKAVRDHIAALVTAPVTDETRARPEEIPARDEGETPEEYRRRLALFGIHAPAPKVPDDPLAGVRWICSACTTVNGIDDERCLGCSKPREEKDSRHPKTSGGTGNG